MSTTIRKALAAALIGLAVACGGGDSPAPSVATTDSAGVTIVRHGPGFHESVPEWEVADEPSLVLGTEGGEVAFGRITDVSVGPEGDLAVTDATTQEILTFGADGAPARRLGGPGDGPGEFRGLQQVLWLPGDSLAGYEGNGARLTVFGPDGAVAREVAFTRLLEQQVYTELHPLSRGSFALVPFAWLHGDSVGVYRNSTEAFKVSAGGERLAGYGRFPGHVLFRSRRAMGVAAFAPLLVATEAGGQLVVGTGEGPQIRIFGEDSGLRRIIRWADWDRTVTEADYEALVETMAAAAPEEQREAAARQISTDWLPADVRPPYDRIVGSPVGEVWVGLYRGPQAENPNFAPPPAQVWWVFGPDGVMVATTTTPEGFVLHHVGGDYVAGVHRDRLGVETVRTYALSRVER